MIISHISHINNKQKMIKLAEHMSAYGCMVQGVYERSFLNNGENRLFRNYNFVAL